MRAPAYRLVRRPADPAPALVDDPIQRHVVAHTDGPLLVVGGPGTGKTTTLVEAVAARVAEGADPERILVLTFGRRGAGALRDRIEARIAGTPGRIVHEPLVRTFHAYAFGLLRRAAAEHGEPSPRLLTGPEQDLIIRELLEVVGDDEPDPVGWPPELRAALPTRAFAQQLRDLMQRAAERGVGPVELARIGERVGRADWPAAARFLREYVGVLALRESTSRGSTAYDPAELVRAASGLLRDDPDLLAAERRRLSCVYVDELAETDPAQIELLHLVAGGGTPLVAFADPDASVYAFRGADPGIVGTFAHQFRTASGAVAETVTLHTGYRAGSGLLAATARVARRLRGPAGHRELRPAPGLPEGDVRVHTFRTATSETAWIAHVLREAHLLHGVPWSRMAILLRSTALQLPPLQRALGTAGVPTVTLAEDLPLHLQPAVAPLLLLLRCALDPDRLDEEAAVALLHSPLGGADPLAERRLRQGLRALAHAAGDRRPSAELLLDALRDPGDLLAIDRRWAAPAQAVARLLATAREAAAAPGANAEQVLWAVWRASGLADRWFGASARGAQAPVGEEAGHARQWRAEAADRDLDAVLVLFDAAARFVDRLPGARTETFLEHVLGQELPADTIAPHADRGEAVRLLTAHAAKGHEWDVVVLAGVQEGIWPDLRLRGSLLGSERLVDVLAGRDPGGPAALAGQTSALLVEERRLFHLAASRARHRLVATAVASAGVGGADGEEQPSRFLYELAGDDPLPPDDLAPPPDDDGGPDDGGPDGNPDGGGPDGGPDGVRGPGDGRGPEDGGEVGADAVRGIEGGRGLREEGDAAVREALAVDGSPLDAGPTVPGRAVPEPVVPAPRSPDQPVELPVGALPRALTLPALVAELRTVVVAEDAEPARRRAAAAELARLAAAGVPGAHPDEWWGLRGLSDDRPLALAGEPVRVTPSAMESALRCSLRWLLERHGGAAPAGPAQGIGNLVHAAAMLAEDASADRQQLIDYVAGRFDAIELAARWLAGTEQARAEGMVDKLLRWLAANPRRLLAIEHEFAVRLGDEQRPIELTGRVDRLEVDERGRLVVIDLKTGKSTVVAAEVEEHAQLAGYQAAVEAGAFAELGGTEESG
ncbi:superfamily I DNA/RNA helicase, partial [Spirilliplanes yamanashiensis]